MKLRAAAFEGLRFQLYFRIFNIVLYQVSSIFLAILLLPVDFALVGLAMIFVGFALIVCDMGIGPALIQRRTDDGRTLRTGMALRLMVSLTLTAALCLLAPAIAGFYGEPRLIAVLWAMAPLLLLNFVAFPARISLTKSLSFRRVFLPDAVGSGAAAVLSLGFALAGFSFWSLIFGQLIGSAIGAILLFLASPWRPMWGLDRALVFQLLRFGLPVMLASVLFYLFQNTGIALLARSNFVDVGYFLFAFTWSISIFLGLQVSIDNVLFPVMSAMNHDQGRVGKAFLGYLRYLAWTIIPLSSFLAATAPTFVLSIVGAKWSLAIPILQVLAPAGAMLALSLAYHSSALALGRSKEVFYYNVIGVSSLLPIATAFIAVAGSIGLAWTFLATATLLFLWALFRCSALSLARVTEFLASLQAPVVSSVAFAVPLFFVQQLAVATLPALAVEAFAALGIYCGSMMLVTRNAFLSEAAVLMKSVFRG